MKAGEYIVASDAKRRKWKRIGGALFSIFSFFRDTYLQKKYLKEGKAEPKKRK